MGSTIFLINRDFLGIIIEIEFPGILILSMTKGA